MSDEPNTDRVPGEDWPTCAGLVEPGGRSCTGVKAGATDLCWAHLSLSKFMEVLSSLKPGGELDLRGTSLAADRLRLILSAMRDPGDHKPRIGKCAV